MAHCWSWHSHHRSKSCPYFKPVWEPKRRNQGHLQLRKPSKHNQLRPSKQSGTGGFPQWERILQRRQWMALHRRKGRHHNFSQRKGKGLHNPSKPGCRTICHNFLHINDKMGGHGQTNILGKPRRNHVIIANSILICQIIFRRTPDTLEMWISYVMGEWRQ